MEVLKKRRSETEVEKANRVEIDTDKLAEKAADLFRLIPSTWDMKIEGLMLFSIKLKEWFPTRSTVLVMCEFLTKKWYVSTKENHEKIFEDGEVLTMIMFINEMLEAQKNSFNEMLEEIKREENEHQ